MALTDSQKNVLRILARLPMLPPLSPAGMTYDALPRGCGRSLARLRREGLVDRSKSGHWTATAQGRAAAALLPGESP